MNIDDLRVTTNRFPCGFYLLGCEVFGKRWSHHWFGTLKAGETFECSWVSDRLARCFSVHSWGLCRLQYVHVGLFSCALEPALFVDVERVIEPGLSVRIGLTAFDFEPLSVGGP